MDPQLANTLCNDERTSQRSRIMVKAYPLPAQSKIHQELQPMWLIRLLGWLPYRAETGVPKVRARAPQALDPCTKKCGPD
jgi:hypothetical protein